MRGDGQNQLKISAPHPTTETYRLILLLASLISLDSPFNCPFFVFCSEYRTTFVGFYALHADFDIALENQSIFVSVLSSQYEIYNVSLFRMMMVRRLFITLVAVDTWQWFSCFWTLVLIPQFWTRTAIHPWP
jgi:hypothetical protein